jgi:hypothetical protein
MAVWHKIKSWIATEPSVKEWAARIKREKTRNIYAINLRLYWEEHLKASYPTLEAWLDSIRADKKSDEHRTQVKWARDLEDFVLTRTVNKQAISKFLVRPRFLRDYLLLNNPRAPPSLWNLAFTSKAVRREHEFRAHRGRWFFVF